MKINDSFSEHFYPKKTAEILLLGLNPLLLKQTEELQRAEKERKSWEAVAQKALYSKLVD